MSAPSAHKSTPLLCPKFKMISGARYSGVPHTVHVLRPRAIAMSVLAPRPTYAQLSYGHLPPRLLSPSTRVLHTVDGTGSTHRSVTLLATPKSASLILPLTSNSRFSGLTSLCTTSRLCM
jgi:hypothetical protein